MDEFQRKINQHSLLTCFKVKNGEVLVLKKLEDISGNKRHYKIKKKNKIEQKHHIVNK